MNRKGQVFPIERRALLKHAGLAAAGFAVMPLRAIQRPVCVLGTQLLGCQEHPTANEPMVASYHEILT